MHKLISAYATYFSAHGIDAAAPPSPRRLVSSCNIHSLPSQPICAAPRPPLKHLNANKFRL